MGTPLFDAATLHALMADAEGREMTLAQLEAPASMIHDYYRDHSYSLSRAIIPAQKIHDGVVESLGADRQGILTIFPAPGIISVLTIYRCQVLNCQLIFQDLAPTPSR